MTEFAPPADSTPILMYHKVAPVNPMSTLKGHYVSPRLFARHMASIAARGYKPIPFSELAHGKPSERAIVLTFDDGYENFFLNALPVLVRHGFPATVFLVANQLGGQNAWDMQDGDVSERLLSVSQIKEALHAGVEFGSHTLDHVDLAATPSAEAWRQIVESRHMLQDILGRPVDTFCYPYGRHTPAVREMVQRAGYRIACGTSKGPNTRDTDRFDFHRVNVRRSTVASMLHYKIRRDVGHSTLK